MFLDVALQDFLTHLAVERNASPCTVKAYRADLAQLLAFLTRQTGVAAIGADSLTPPLLRAYAVQLRQQGYARSSIQQHLSAVRSFCAFLTRFGHLASSPAGTVRLPRADRKLPKVLTRAQVEALLTAPAADTPAGLRDRAILEVLYSGGLRVSELCTLNVEDVQLEQGAAKVRGKGKRERLAILGPPAVAALQAWLAHRDDLIRLYFRNRRGVAGLQRALSRLADEPAVFINYSGSRLSTRSVDRLFCRTLRAAGLDSAFSPHSLRHACATHLLDAGANLRHVQEALGHATLSSTQIYTHVSVARLREVFERTHPRA